YLITRPTPFSSYLFIFHCYFIHPLYFSSHRPHRHLHSFPTRRSSDLSTTGSVAPIERPVAMTTVCSSAVRRRVSRIGGDIAPSWSTSVPSTSRPISRDRPAIVPSCSR